MGFLDRLDEIRRAESAILDRFSLDRVEAYFRFLEQRNAEGGFFSAGDTDRIADRHVFESMAYVARIMSLPGVSRETRLLDVGSGPGLPGMLFACLSEPPYVTLLDSSRRRLSLVEKEFGSSGRLAFAYSRAEEYRGSFDVVTARALIPFPFNALLVRHLTKSRIAFLVGPTPLSNRALARLSEGGLEWIAEESCPLPELEFLGERNLLVLRKKRPGALLPVAWKKIKDEMDEWRKSSQ